MHKQRIHFNVKIISTVCNCLYLYLYKNLELVHTSNSYYLAENMTDMDLNKIETKKYTSKERLIIFSVLTEVTH